MKIVNGWVDEAIEIDYSQKSMSRSGYSIKYIVIHGTAGGSSAEAIANYFATSTVDASAHLIIGQDGHIVQGISMNDAAWGNGIITQGHASFIQENINPNLYTVSIEFVKASTDNSDALTDAQQQSGFELIACICDTYGIPKQPGDANGGIIAHATIDPVNRSRCPGTFSWDALWTYLAHGGNTTMTIDITNGTVASHFTGNTDNSIWTCKDNGFLIGHAILDFYRSFGGNALCGLTHLGLPLSNELPVHGYPGVVQQEFERGAVRWDPNHACDNPPGSGPVYLIHTNQDPRWLTVQTQIATLQAEIVTLQALPATANLLQINTLGSQIVKLSQVQ